MLGPGSAWQCGPDWMVKDEAEWRNFAPFFIYNSKEPMQKFETLRQTLLALDFLAEFLFILVGSPCKKLTPYNNAFWDFNNGGKKTTTRREKFLLAQMGVLAPGAR
jgi:hypothetical protein